MKKLVLIFALFLGMQSAYSQCTTGANIGALPQPTGAWQTISVSAGIPAYRTFNATAGCTYIFSYCQGGGSYTGDPYLTIANNTPTAQIANDDFCGLGSQITWNCTVTGIYRIYFSGCCPCNNAPTSTLAYMNSSAPANDVCSAATPIAVPSTTTGNTTGCASPETTTCNTWSSNGLWYSVVGDGQQYTASLCGSSYDTWLSVYSGTCAGLTCVVQNDDFCGLQSQVSFCTTLGTTYYILVNGFGSNNGAWTMAMSKSNVTASAAPSTVCAGSPVTLTGTGGGVYTWNPGALTGASVVVNPVATTTYTLSTVVGGCTITRTVTVTVNPLPTITTTTTAGTICAGNSTSITASGGVTYTWMPGSLTGTTVTVSPATTTTYTVTGTNASGCSNTSTRTITVNPLPTVTANSTAAAVCSGGSVTLTGGGATSYTWTGGVTDGISFVPTITGTYTVTGTDGNGCTNTAATTVTVNALPTVVANSTAAAVCAGGNVTLTGSGATSYTWTGGVTDGISFVPTITDTYTVTGTDGNGCTNTAATTVTVNALPTVTASSTAAAVCAGGSVTLTGSGATSYTWDNGVTDGLSFVPTATTTYMVTGTDGNGCTDTDMISVTVNALPTVTANSTAAAVCAGGSVTLTGGGATTYTWDNGVTDGLSFVPTATTTYMVTGTDGNGCVNTATTTVTVNALPVVALGADVVQCGGTVMFDAGNVGSTYLWSDASTAQTITLSATDTVYVDVTDVNGCMGSDTAMATINALPTVALGADTTNCGSVTLDAGNVGSTYLWSDASTTQTITVSATDTVYVDVTDANGCMSSDTIMVTVNTPPTVTGTAASSVVCVDDASVALTGSPVGGTWSGPGVTGSSFSPSAAGVGAQTATYTFTDVNGCTGTADANIQVNACVSVVETSLSNGVNVFPNPNSGSFTLAVNANVGDMVIEMVDMQGRVVYSSIENNVQAGYNKQISMENVANGVYMLRMTTASEQNIVKISVQK